MAKKAAEKRDVVSVSKKYELMLILSPDLRESEVKKKLKELEEFMESAGGKVIEEDFWGKKKLAYRIKKHNEGIYMVYNLELPGNFIQEFKTHLRIEKDVVRSMLISVPKDYLYTRYDIEGMGDREVSTKPKKKDKPVTEKKEEKKPIKDLAEEKSVDEFTSEKPKKKSSIFADAESDTADDNKKEDTKDKDYESELDKKLDALLDGDDLKL